MLKKAYSQYALFVALLKFDFFVFIAFCLQVSMAGCHRTSTLASNLALLSLTHA